MHQSIPSHEDGPSYAEFDIQRGDTSSIGIVMLTQDIYTQEVSVYDLSGKTAYWINMLPLGQQVASTDVSGGLLFDQATGTLIYPFTATATASLPATPIRTVIRVQDAATGEVTTWLDGYIVPRG